MGDESTSWVLFLRGINVGGHRKVPMADLRRVIAEVTGDRGATTYIASGNVAFRASGLSGNSLINLKYSSARCPAVVAL